MMLHDNDSSVTDADTDLDTDCGLKKSRGGGGITLHFCSLINCVSCKVFQTCDCVRHKLSVDPEHEFYHACVVSYSAVEEKHNKAAEVGQPAGGYDAENPEDFCFLAAHFNHSLPLFCSRPTSLWVWSRACGDLTCPADILDKAHGFPSTEPLRSPSALTKP